MSKNNRLLKIDEDTHNKLKSLSRELSVIEENDVHMNDIPKRLLTSEDILERLRKGSRERREGIK